MNCDPGSVCNEGTAMAEIIHDIAPDAELAVGAAGTTLEFIQRIDDLVNDFGATIIVDDIGFRNEPFFEDGPVAQAVAAVAGDVVFVSAAGNSANNHHESAFRDISTIDPSYTDALHVFGFDAQGPDWRFQIYAEPGGVGAVFLQWQEAFGAAAIDLDLHVDVYNTETQEYLGTLSSTNPQTGSDDPVEDVGFCNVFDHPVIGLFYVISNEVTNPGFFQLELQAATNGNSAIVQYTNSRGSVYGHPGVPDVLAVGAIDASDPGLDTLQSYSSQGPATIYFPQTEVRSKPDIAAVDGVSVTGAGGFPQRFYGTSAAAPHAAGIAALLKEIMPDATSADIRSAIKDGVVDLYLSGADIFFGEGRLSALGAEGQLDSDGDETPNLTDQDDDNDGRDDSFDLARLDPLICSDTDRDGCDDCVNGFFDPADDGVDVDSNGMCDDGDFDLDTIFNIADNCPRSPNLDQADSDENGAGDACDVELCAPIRVSGTRFHFVCP